MAFVHLPPGWQIPESQATPEHAYLNRRAFLKKLGLTSAVLSAGPSLALGDAETEALPPLEKTPTSELYPFPRNPAYAVERPLTPEPIAGSYNNFYEFTTDKERVRLLVGKFAVRPWQVQVGGLVHHPRVYEIDDLVRRMPLEERVYRFRCVEAWAMTVPWTGFPFRALIDEVQPLSSARYVRLVTFLRPEQAPGQRTQPWYPWPYFEGLTLHEATNELTLLATGIYGHELPRQHGAPLRLVVPWKYGYKSIKSIVSIEFVEEQPPTFWNEVAPREYDFWSNVNPKVPHPRWSQAHERLIDTGERVPTRLYNGYGEYVAHLYHT
jgi:sulfoxide reductase catalytic subunit YedY